MTNQPDIHVPYLLAWAGDGRATRGLVERIVRRPMAHRYTNAGVRPQPWIGRSFAATPQGFADGMDDDAGTMSAWYVWSMLGLYPLVPGTGQYVTTAPLARSATLRVPGSEPITFRRGGDDQIMIDGKQAPRPVITHAAIVAGLRSAE